MARGFESKDVEFQQSEAERPKAAGTALTAEQRATQSRRRTLELALSRAQSDLALARAPAHQVMLAQAVDALREQIRQLE